MKKLARDRRSGIIGRARCLSRSFLGQTISFHHQGRVLQGIFLDIAPDGGLLLSLPGAEKKNILQRRTDLIRSNLKYQAIAVSIKGP